MSKKRWRIVGIVALLGVIAVGVVVVLDPFPGNRVSSNVYGDSGPIEIAGVSAGRHSPARFERDGKSATVQLGEQTARVFADRVELPGGRVVPIPAGCKAVELREARDGMRVFLDGTEVP
jgi:hypothetical protein